MPSIANFRACIKVNGEELPEYDVQVDEKEKNVSCWIPSEAGKNFSVDWYTQEVMSIDTCGWVRLDGVAVGGVVDHAGSKVEQDYAYQHTSATSGRYFSFAPISYTDDDAFLGTSCANIGEIRLKICHIKMGRPSMSIDYKHIESHTKLHERSKKLGGHCVQFGKEQTFDSEPVEFASATPLKTLATFLFRYRPLEILQANGIAPLPPRSEADNPSQEATNNITPEQEEEDSSDEDVEDQMNKLKEELQKLEARRAKKRKVKTEKVDPPLYKKVKTEKSDTFLKNEVIDLT